MKRPLQNTICKGLAFEPSTQTRNTILAFCYIGLYAIPFIYKAFKELLFDAKVIKSFEIALYFH